MASQTYTFFTLALVLLPIAVLEADALNYASVDSADGQFELKWAYSNNMLMFNMTCKTNGWCAVAFTTNPGGKNMVNYDIALGGVSSGGDKYLDDYWSTTTSNPSPKDASQDYKLISARKEGGKTYVDFYRNATTKESDKDVQFMSNTEVYIAWALNTADGNSGLTQHTAFDVFSTKHNLIMEAMNAGKTTPAPTTKAALKYVSVNSGDNFELKWAYSNNMLMFNMTCKTTGWCAVAFTTNSGGRGMKNYDIAVGGVTSGGAEYLDDYWSTTTSNPSPKDASQDYKLIRAMEDDTKTYVDFYRNATTTENDKDVQFMSDTEVYIAWALHASADANSGLTQHTAFDVFPTKRNLIMEAMNAGRTTSTSTSTSTTTKTPTTNAASEASSRVMAFAILALTACVLTL